MANEACKNKPSKTGIETEIESEGFYVFASFSDSRTNETVLLKLHRRAANALQALLASCDGAGEDAGGVSVVLRGEMTITRKDNAESPTISAAQ